MPFCSASERSALSSETGKRTVWRTSLNARLHRDSAPLSPKMAEDHHSWEGEKRRCRIAISKNGGQAGCTRARGVYPNCGYEDRKSVVSGESVSVRLDLGACRNNKTKNPKQKRS